MKTARLAVAQLSTASMGKFDGNLKHEPKKKKLPGDKKPLLPTEKVSDKDRDLEIVRFVLAVFPHIAVVNTHTLSVWPALITQSPNAPPFTQDASLTPPRTHTDAHRRHRCHGHSCILFLCHPLRFRWPLSALQACAGR